MSPTGDGVTGDVITGDSGTTQEAVTSPPPIFTPPPILKMSGVPGGMSGEGFPQRFSRFDGTYASRKSFFGDRKGTWGRRKNR